MAAVLEGAVTSETHPDRGRCAVASKDFAAGQLIWRERPIAAVLHHTRWGRCCNSCYRQAWAMGTHTVYCCSGCSRYVYCSRECARTDWQQGHARECLLLQRLPSSIKPDTVELLLLARLMQSQARGQTLGELQSAAQRARDNGEDDLYYSLRRQIKRLQTLEGSATAASTQLALPQQKLSPQPALQEWTVVDGVRQKHTLDTAVAAAAKSAGTGSHQDDSGGGPGGGAGQMFLFNASDGSLVRENAEPEPEGGGGDEPQLLSEEQRQEQAKIEGVLWASFPQADELEWHRDHLEDETLHNLAIMAEAHGVATSKIEAGKWFARFQANNFYLARDDSGRAPVESAWAPVASAVCPRIALLNHSCAPNCAIVTIWPPEPPPHSNAGLQRKEGIAVSARRLPMLGVVARRDIAAGEELCHSYIDQSDATSALTGGGAAISDSGSDDEAEAEEAPGTSNTSTTSDSPRAQPPPPGVADAVGADDVAWGGVPGSSEGDAGRARRQRVLKQKYGFTCSCPRCGTPPATAQPGSSSDGRAKLTAQSDK